jgi:hypothetical protein
MASLYTLSKEDKIYKLMFTVTIICNTSSHEGELYNQGIGSNIPPPLRKQHQMRRSSTFFGFEQAEVVSLEPVWGCR